MVTTITRQRQLKQKAVGRCAQCGRIAIRGKLKCAACAMRLAEYQAAKYRNDPVYREKCKAAARRSRERQKARRLAKGESLQ